jgi:hypothetical protein
MAAGSTYTPIATATSNGSTTEFNFTSLPSYTDIVLVFNGSTNASNDIYCRLNADGATNYSQTRVYGSGSSAASDRSSNADAWSFNIGNTTGAQVIRLNFQNTNQTSTYKTVITRSDNPSYFLGSHVGLWRSTAAISSIRIFTTNSFTTGTTATIYGIAAA